MLLSKKRKDSGPSTPRTWTSSPTQYPRLKDKVTDIKRSALIFPFKASPYLVDELIDWDMAGDIGLDPFYKLVFPTMDMLTQEHQDLLNSSAVMPVTPRPSKRPSKLSGRP